MTSDQEHKIKELIEKYNDVLKVTMRLAVSEDLINLMIVNNDDKDFELAILLKDKDALSNFIMKEFLKYNSNSVSKELGKMTEKKLSIQKQKKLRF